MNQEEAGQLLDKYLQNKTSPPEEAFVQSWLINQTVKQSSDQNKADYPLPDKIWAAVHQATYRKPRPLWPRILVAAAAVTAIIFGLWFYNTRQAIVNPNAHILAQNDIAPGKNKATLTLANGKIIDLSTGKSGIAINADKLSYSDGTEIKHTPTALPKDIQDEKNNMMLTAATPRGGTYQVKLPDGTHVWLNADSKISFPPKFTGKTRKIILSGEAYLEVAKNKNQPFIVQSKGQTVEVLGTHFNLSAYEEERSTKTTLVEGSVKVIRTNILEAAQQIILKPGQQSILLTTKPLVVKEVNTDDAVSWKDGYFVFNDELLPEVMRKIARWYNVEVDYSAANQNRRFGGTVSRYEHISKVLSKLELTGDIHFKIEGRRITVIK